MEESTGGSVKTTVSLLATALFTVYAPFPRDQFPSVSAVVLSRGSLNVAVTLCGLEVLSTTMLAAARVGAVVSRVCPELDATTSAPRDAVPTTLVMFVDGVTRSLPVISEVVMNV